MPEKCPYCGNTELLTDYFDDEAIYFCSRCMREVIEEVEDETEMLFQGHGD